MRIKPFGILVLGSNGVRIRRDATEHVSISYFLIQFRVFETKWSILEVVKYQ